MYKPQDVALLAGIKKMLRDDGMTIRGAQKILDRRGKEYVKSLAEAGAGPSNLDIAGSQGADLPGRDTGGEISFEEHVLASASERLARGLRKAEARPGKSSEDSQRETVRNLVSEIHDLRNRLTEKIR